MGCCGDREKGLVNVAADQKWDYIVRCVDKASMSWADFCRISQISGRRHV
jgi:hypothetical protein